MMTYDSFVKNCYLGGDGSLPNPDHPLFVCEGNKIYARLDGYAIIPIQKYKGLKRLAEIAAQTITDDELKKFGRPSDGTESK